LEIVIEYFQGKEKFGCLQARACLMGEVGKDLRFIGVFSDEEEKIQCDFKKIAPFCLNGAQNTVENYIEFIFSHPDFTVGFGITPNQPYGSRTIPPVGNYTLPRRITFIFSLSYFILFRLST